MLWGFELGLGVLFGVGGGYAVVLADGFDEVLVPLDADGDPGDVICLGVVLLAHRVAQLVDAEAEADGVAVGHLDALLARCAGEESGH